MINELVINCYISWLWKRRREWVWGYKHGWSPKANLK